MKKKYFDMVNSYVQDKMGDLAPDVLSEEVKYKILFKIYKKRLKQQKKKTAVLCERVAELQQTLMRLTEPAEDKRVPAHSCLTCTNFIPYTTYTDNDGASFVERAKCSKGRDIDNQENPCPDWCKIGMCVYHDASGRKYFYTPDEPEEEPKFCYQCKNAVYYTDIMNGKQCQQCKRCHKHMDPAECGDFEETADE